MKIEPNFNIDFHKQLIQYTLDYAYKNQFVAFGAIKKMVKPALIGTTGAKGLKEEDIRYIFALLVSEGYLKPDRFGLKDAYEITDKGRIFYLITYW